MSSRGWPAGPYVVLEDEHIRNQLTLYCRDKMHINGFLDYGTHKALIYLLAASPTLHDALTVLLDVVTSPSVVVDNPDMQEAFTEACEAARKALSDARAGT